MTGQYVSVDLSQWAAFFAKIRKAGGGDLKKALALFMQGAGAEFLRVVEDEIIRRKVMDTRLLLSSFHEGAGENVFAVSDGGLTVEIGTGVRYAAFVNDGHWTNPQGVASRFVPGIWEGDRFVYTPGAKTGMVLKQKWVEGAHYFDGALRIFEKMFPDLLDAALRQWLTQYFSEFH